MDHHFPGEVSVLAVLTLAFTHNAIVKASNLALRDTRMTPLIVLVLGQLSRINNGELSSAYGAVFHNNSPSALRDRLSCE
jgi:hypothetical protein